VVWIKLSPLAYRFALEKKERHRLKSQKELAGVAAQAFISLVGKS
jgi:hypothetical protein